MKIYEGVLKTLSAYAIILDSSDVMCITKNTCIKRLFMTVIKPLKFLNSQWRTSTEETCTAL